MESEKSRAAPRTPYSLSEEFEKLIISQFMAVPTRSGFKILPRNGAWDALEQWWDDVEKRP